MNQNITKIVSSAELKAVPVKRLNDPTTAIPVLRVHQLTESEMSRKPFVLRETKLEAH
jgi:hypothetical protein